MVLAVVVSGDKCSVVVMLGYRARLRMMGDEQWVRNEEKVLMII